MLTLESTDKIQTLPATQLEMAAEIFSLAFIDYPVTRYCFADQGGYFDRAVRAFFRYSCTHRAAIGGQHLTVARQGQLVGVAGITLPEQAPLPAALQDKWAWLAAVLGPQTNDRLERFGQLTARNRPHLPHFTLNMIGVLPAASGQGHGRALLDAVHARAEAHPLASGVYLDTDTPSNVAMYEHFGYRVISREQLDDLPIWCMFRPNRRRG